MKKVCGFKKTFYLCNAFENRKRVLFEKNIGEVAEWSIAAVLKTVELRGSGGSNPSLSAERSEQKQTINGQKPTSQ